MGGEKVRGRERGRRRIWVRKKREKKRGRGKSRGREGERVIKESIGERNKGRMEKRRVVSD